jgi:inactivated superfamily I helicase/RecB family exonuclease
MLKNNLIVLPTSRAIREITSKEKSQNQLLPKYISIGDFFGRIVLDEKNRKFCEKNLKILYLKEAIKNSSLDKLGLSHDFTTFVKQSEYLFRFFTEISNNYVTFDTLLEHDTYIHYSDHIEILKHIHKTYCEILDQNGFVDNIMLPLSYIINREYIEQFENITLYIEGYLSKFEQKIISDIAALVQTNIKITFNEFNKKNMELFELEENLEENISYTIDLTNKKIIESNLLKNKNKDIVISPVSSQIEQAAFIKYQIVQMVKSGIEPEKIAVAVPNEKISSILELFDKEHYFNFAMGRGLNNSKITQTIRHITKILVDHEPKDEHISVFLELDMQIFNNLFKKNWSKKLTKDIFNDIFEYIYSLENNEEILEKLEQIKISLNILLFSNISNVTNQVLVKEFMKLLQNQISSITVDDVNGGKITVLGILETRLTNFDGIIVCDFNDDKVPKISVKDKFISSKLKEYAGLPTITDRENLQRYYYKRLFDNAKSIAVCYIDDESLVMSRFIMQLFPNYKEYIRPKDYNSLLFNTKRLQHFNSEISLDIDLSTREWSATSLKTYLTCKRKYYLSYIAGIKDHVISIKPQNFDIGNIIHNALESGVKNQSLNKNYLYGYLTKESKNNPYLVLELELWKKKLEKFLDLEEERKQSGIQISEAEKPFKLQYNGITIKGKIDRIDKYPDNTYEILDYKTSSSLKIDTLKTYEDSKDFQLEFYYLACRDKMIKDVAYYSLSECAVKNEVVLNEKLELLDLHFKTLKTAKVDFAQTDNYSDCQFCAYKTICDRD